MLHEDGQAKSKEKVPNKGWVLPSGNPIPESILDLGYTRNNVMASIIDEEEVFSQHEIKANLIPSKLRVS